ncbi:non-hydrolyzing UDP-N-acetylglucosamine 2-epimerase [Staphylococcus caprae]|uniref:non-hydrolyzing UDP-N-acetylglucosamine 2-epimerase n=1 Tax=Staphylococcus caprae TaxID=29380 RepID=UPI003B227994
MKKIMTIFGTRPEAIKMAPLVKEIEKNPNFNSIVVITAQHREMLDSVLEIFDVKSNYDLNVMKENQTLSELTSNVLTKLDSIIKKEQPDLILVHGDTTTTFAGSLSAFYNQLPIGHVEAGLRTWNKYSPFPEELNRVMVGNMADLNFAPTNKAAENLRNENKSPESIAITGNTAIDAMKFTIKPNYKSHILTKHEGKKLILLTSHRRENIGLPMHNIFSTVRTLVEENEDIVIVFPIHKNPKVREIAYKYLKGHERIEIVEPLDVIDFHNFVNASYLILTDSGGVQEEAPTLGKPVLVLRDTTERPEGVEAGTLKVIGTSVDAVYNETKELITNIDKYNKMSNASNPYGDGFASLRICENIEFYFGIRDKQPVAFRVK